MYIVHVTHLSCIWKHVTAYSDVLAWLLLNTILFNSVHELWGLPFKKVWI